MQQRRGEGVSVPERAARIVNYLWTLAAAVVFVLWLQDPGLFARESIAARLRAGERGWLLASSGYRWCEASSWFRARR